MRITYINDHNFGNSITKTIHKTSYFNLLLWHKQTLSSLAFYLVEIDSLTIQLQFLDHKINN